MITLDKTGAVHITGPAPKKVIKENEELHFEDLFIQTKCDKDPDSNIKSRDLYNAYVDFCKETDHKPLTINTFVKNLKKHGLNHKKTREGNSHVSYFTGLKLHEG